MGDRLLQLVHFHVQIILMRQADALRKGEPDILRQFLELRLFKMQSCVIGALQAEILFAFSAGESKHSDNAKRHDH